MEGREKIFLTLQMLRKLKAAIQTTLETGKLAQKELEHKQTPPTAPRDIAAIRR